MGSGAVDSPNTPIGTFLLTSLWCPVLYGKYVHQYGIVHCTLSFDKNGTSLSYVIAEPPPCIATCTIVSGDTTTAS